jgi:hypothetical protein
MKYGIRYEITPVSGPERFGWLLNSKDKPAQYDSYDAACFQVAVERARADFDMLTQVRYRVMPLTKPERTPQP